MALFCSPQNLFLERNHAAQKSLLSRRNISNFTTLKFNFTKPSLYASLKFVNTVILNDKCCSSLSSSDEPEKSSPSTSIVFVKGLPQLTSEKRLRMVFSEIGEICRVKLIYDKTTKQPLGIAYVWFTNEEDAQVAVEVMNGKFFDGKFIHVTIAKPGSCKPRPRSTPYKF